MSAARRIRHGSAVRVAVIAVVFVAVYAAIVVLFASHERSQVEIDGSTEFPDPVIVSLEPRVIDASGRSIELLITPDPTTGALKGTDGYSFGQDGAVVIVPSNGERQIDFAQNRIVGSVRVQIPFDSGRVETWPFDTYRVEAAIVMATVAGDDGTAVATEYTAQGSVPGWIIDMTAHPPAGSDQPLPYVEITAHRPVATIAFAIVLLALMVVMPVLVLMVAISAYRGTRKVEATLMSWMGAMLFATIPLRNFFPGSPPIGSWVDYLVVLWVIVGLVASLAIYIVAWMRYGPPGREAPATLPEGPPTPTDADRS
jgi:hypothetical protein